MKKRLLVPVMLLALAGTGCGEEKAQAPSVSVGPQETDLPSVAERWDIMTKDEQKAVCTAASGPLPGEGEVGGASTHLPGTDPEVDYREMLHALEKAGYDQKEATAMLPYALEKCR